MQGYNYKHEMPTLICRHLLTPTSYDFGVKTPESLLHGLQFDGIFEKSKIDIVF